MADPKGGITFVSATYSLRDVIEITNIQQSELTENHIRFFEIETGNAIHIISIPKKIK